MQLRLDRAKYFEMKFSSLRFDEPGNFVLVPFELYSDHLLTRVFLDHETKLVNGHTGSLLEPTGSGNQIKKEG